MCTNPPFHLIATDLDGTLLNLAHEIPLFSKSILQQVVRENPYDVCVALVSGRPYADLVFHLKELELPDHSGFIISCNGARVHRLATAADGQRELVEIFCASLLPEDAYFLLTTLPSSLDDIIIQIVQEDCWYVNTPIKDELVYFQKSGFHYELFEPSKWIQEYQEWAAGSRAGPEPLHGVDKVIISCGGRRDVAQSIFDRVKAEKPDLLTSFSSPSCLEFNAANVSKANGISALLPHLHTQWAPAESSGNADQRCDACVWSLQDCVAFGDADNDLEMLKEVGKGFAMKNSSAFLRQNVPSAERIGSNAEEAVSKKIKELFHLE